MAHNLDEAARAGYYGNDNPYLFSSPNYYAHELGKHMDITGRSVPHDVRMSRGYKIRANGMLFKIMDSLNRTSFERIE